jgi:hypothetical protein
MTDEQIKAMSTDELYMVISDHKGDQEITAIALRLAKRARVAEELNKVITGLLDVAKCPNCDGSGGTAVQVAEADWIQEQCQWCYEKNEALNKL